MSATDDSPPLPRRRLRRLKGKQNLRRLVAQTRIDASRLVLPVFVADDIDDEHPIEALPGHYHRPPARVGIIAKEAESLGIPGLLIFGVSSTKDESATRAYHPQGPAQLGIAEAKAAAPDLVIFADTCLCGYTNHGHCGVVRDGEVDNDASLELLARTALSQAQAGADFVAPSDMMDGRVAAIRRSLDDAGRSAVGIMSYAAKFSSAFYGPFREAVGSSPSFGDRSGYQIAPGDRRQAMASIARDLEEGADIIMVKPALAYLDVIGEARGRFDAPISAYSVSGEYAMIKAAADRGLLDELAAVIETLTCIVRAGADFVITYHALEAARFLASEA